MSSLGSSNDTLDALALADITLMASAVLPEITVPAHAVTGRARSRGASPSWLAGSIVALFSFLLVPRSISDPDIWWHLQNAKLQLASHSFLRQDVYSYSAANSRWMNHEWLAELPFLAGWNSLGAMGLYLVMLATVTLIMLGVLMLARRESGSYAAALLAIVPAILLSSVSYGPRTLLFGWVLLVLELALLQNFRSAAGAGRQLWLLPVLFAVWVNTHGSWMIGLVLFAVFAVTGLFRFDVGGIYARPWSAAKRNTLYKVGCTCVAALFCNPYGWRLVFYPFDMAFRQKLNIQSVEEWHSVDFHLFRGKLFLATLALLVLFRILQRTRWSLQDAAFALIAVYSGLTYSRFLFLAAILLTPLLARDLAAWLPPPGREKRFFNTLALAAVAYMIFSHFPARSQIEQQPQYPIAAMQALERKPPAGRTLNEYLWGGYIELHMPSLKTYIDSRVDIFEYNGTLRTYLDIIHLQNSLALMDEEHINNAFIAANSPLAYLLLHTPGWKTVYRDDVAILFTRERSS